MAKRRLCALVFFCLIGAVILTGCSGFFEEYEPRPYIPGAPSE